MAQCRAELRQHAARLGKTVCIVWLGSLPSLAMIDAIGFASTGRVALRFGLGFGCRSAASLRGILLPARTVSRFRHRSCLPGRSSNIRVGENDPASPAVPAIQAIVITETNRPDGPTDAACRCPSTATARTHKISRPAEPIGAQPHDDAPRPLSVLSFASSAVGCCRKLAAIHGLASHGLRATVRFLFRYRGLGRPPARLTKTQSFSRIDRQASDCLQMPGCACISR
jgi:hypothetical protein